MSSNRGGSSRATSRCSHSGAELRSGEHDEMSQRQLAGHAELAQPAASGAKYILNLALLISLSVEHAASVQLGVHRGVTSAPGQSGQARR